MANLTLSFDGQGNGVSVSEESSAGRGKIGPQIFEEVEALVASEKITRSEAFKRISERTGRREGTVAANYYRIARQSGATIQPRTRRGPGRPRGRRSAAAVVAGSGDVASALARVNAAVAELSAALRRQESENAKLREENKSFEEIRRLMRKVG